MFLQPSMTMGEVSLPTAYLAAAILLMTIIIAISVSRPSHDPREPPLISPTIPVVGHLLGILRHQVHYFNLVFERNRLPIVALPIVNSKVYVLFSAHLQQIAMRSKAMDGEGRTVQLIPRIFDVEKKTLLGWLGRDGVHQDMSPSMMKLFSESLTGEPLNDLTSRTLAEVSLILNGIGQDGLRIDNLYLWLRYHISLAVSVALFGKKHNPYSKSREIIDSQWEFELGLGPLVFGFLPSVIARSAYLARARVQNALRPYYEAGHDQEQGVSDLVKGRGKLFRKWDTPLDQLSKNEISVMLAATTNTIPTMFWYMAHVWTRPELVEQLRAEVAEADSCLRGRIIPPDGTKEMTIRFNELDAKCPLLGSCYREAIRLSSQILTLRRVATDTVITDGDGCSYLLKAGNDVMIPAKVLHRNRATWGEDVDEFNPTRFLPDPDGDKERDKLKKISFVPFGGGKHYCPGRNFAFAENLAVMAALLMGFEVDGLDKDNLLMEDSKMGQAAKPVPGFEGGPAVIRRRKGWEHVEWKFQAS